MKKKEVSKIKRISISILLMLITSALAIVSKNLLPSDVNVKDFNSIFVKALGFPLVASLYFIMIYSHNAIVTQFFGKRTELSNIQIGIRFGICFALIYIVGMQEVVVEGSPFSAWGIDFVIYQFFMGAGEAIVALLMCIAIAKLTISDKKHSTTLNIKISNKLSLVIFVSAAFTIERTICYKTGIITSNVDKFPFPSYAWTILFGIVLGYVYIILYPIFYGEKNSVYLSSKIMIVTIGFCWIIFNLFIGLIFEGALGEVLLRSGLDVIAVFLSVLLWHKCFDKKVI